MAAESPYTAADVEHHISAAQRSMRVQTSSADQGMGNYAERATAQALIAIALSLNGIEVALSNLAPCPLTPLPAPGVDMTKPE